MFQRIVCYFILSGILLSLHGKERVSFLAEDSLKITADLYLKDRTLPFIILFHQAEASRGEYTDIAPRLLKLDYNCLVVDLRVGNKFNYITNETAVLAKKLNYSRSLMEADKDISAALSYVSRFNTKDVVLIGSSYSASLCLIRAAKSEAIKSVIAFSPGEYFRPELTVREEVSNLGIQVFISSTKNELEYIKQMMAPIPKALIHFYYPSKGEGEHGAKMLWNSSNASDECWFELLLFFKKIRYK